MKRLLALVCLCSLVMAALVATGAHAAKPVLKVGTSADFPPFEFQDEKTGAYLGFDLDLIRAIGDAIGMDVQIVNTGWDGLIPGLITGNYDCIASAMTITDERLKAVNFSDPYFSAGQVVVTMAKDTAIKSVADLEGKKISVQIGTTGDLVASDIKGATVKRFNLAPDAIQEVRNGASHACIIDLAVAAEIAREYKDIKYGAPFTMEYYGIAISRSNAALLKKINRGLAMVKASGKYDEIYDRWFGSN